jgi:tRNA pseudouridine65 synthase
MQLRILYQDSSIVVVDKPAGFEVHPREQAVGRAKRTCLSILTHQLQKKPYPAHRLDRATAGVLVFSLSPNDAFLVQKQFQEQLVEKKYYCVARGWVENDFSITSALKNEKGEDQNALTHFQVLARAELPVPCGRYETIRLTLLRATPKTGRFHQIRRHLASVSHPILGDPRHGDKKLNRIFASHVGFKRMLLQAHSLQILHPRSQEKIRFQSRWTKDWHRVFEEFAICPIDY